MRGKLAVVLALGVLFFAVACSSQARIRARRFAVHPSAAGQYLEPATPAEDAARLTYLTLALFPRKEVRWRPEQAAESDTLHMTVTAEAGEEGGSRLDRALEQARRSLASLPKKRWRKKALKILPSLGLERLDPHAGDLFLDALRAREWGDPERAVSLIRESVRKSPEPILSYLLGISLLEGGDLAGAADLFRDLSDVDDSLPKPMRLVARGVILAAEGESRDALRLFASASKIAPSFPEGYWARALVRREACTAYSYQRILEDLEMAARIQRCCASCGLARAELEAFTGNPWVANRSLARAEGCMEGALDSARDRALALTLAATGSREESRDAAARAEARDASPLRRGLAPAFLLEGDSAHLEEAYDPEADLRLTPEESLEHHFYSGLSRFWTGRPSAAAAQFERAEEYARKITPEGWSPRGTVQLLTALRIRAYLLAGRLEEAQRFSQEVRDRGREAVTGLVVYSAALVDVEAGEFNEAMGRARALTVTEEKFWRYLTDLEVFLATNRLRRAQVASTNAILGVNTQINICPGVSAEPFILRAQAIFLLAQGRADAAERGLRQLVGLGSRGLFAPDVMVGAWEILGRAREALGDRPGAAEAYRELLRRWGDGEDFPLVARARERLRALSPGEAE